MVNYQKSNIHVIGVTEGEEQYKCRQKILEERRLLISKPPCVTTIKKKGSQTENQQLPCIHQRTEYSEKPESQS